MGYTRDATDLAIMQAYPLDMKVMLTKQRIYEWVHQFGEDGVVVSFSGGKDSTVLLHLVRSCFPGVKAVFSNTGLEYPEIQRFVRSFDNVDIVTPSMNFGDVISTYGYPLIGKEVAEAIHYARRIRSQSVKAERERENSSGRNYLAEESGAYGKQANWKRLEIGGGGEPVYPDKRSEKQTDSPPREDARSRGSREWRDWRRGCL